MFFWSILFGKNLQIGALSGLFFIYNAHCLIIHQFIVYLWKSTIFKRFCIELTITAQSFLFRWTNVIKSYICSLWREIALQIILEDIRIVRINR